jgi:hypothetical protein
VDAAKAPLWTAPVFSDDAGAYMRKRVEWLKSPDRQNRMGIALEVVALGAVAEPLFPRVKDVGLR